MRRRPGEGERNALAGFVPQYKIFAAQILRALHRRSLVAISIADPEAGRLDDIQIETTEQIDAYQVKWSTTAAPVTLAEFSELLRDMTAGRDAIQPHRATQVVAHTHTNRPCSPAALRGQSAELSGASLATFVDEVWRPATDARFESVDAIPERWASFFRGLAENVNLTQEDLLDRAPWLLFEFDQPLPEGAVADDREGELYLADLYALTRTLFDVVSSGDRSVIRIETDDLLRRVGGDWPERGRFRAGGTFPPPADYEEIVSSSAELAAALSSHTSGYVFVLGSPGSGKSTLLTRALRNDDRLVASYFTYLPGDNTATRSEASTFLHDLVLALEERGFRHGGTRPPFTDVDLLQERLRAQLADVAADAQTRSGAVILVDGLDHVGRDPAPARSLLQYLPAPESLPDGVLFVIGTRTADDLPSHVRPAVRQTDRVIAIDRLPRRAVLDLAQRRGLGSLGDEIWRLSDGHPLLMWTFMRLASSLPEDERGSRLAEIPPVDGDITRLYDQLWLEIAGDDDLVELFALVARIRVPFALSWLEETGTNPAAVRRLSRFPHLIDIDDFGRSSFFHDSFRVFVRERTAERAGVYEASIDHRLHRDLGGRCARADRADPVAWEEVHHRLAAADYEGVIECATPEFFRAQLSALRPTAQVMAAIREAVHAIGHVHDANAIARLALAATETQSRSYNLPSDTDLLKALADLSRVEVALAQLGDIRDNVVGNDRRASALEFALHLYDSGNERSAVRIFEAYEPLELFGGPRGSRQQAVDGPWRALRAWAAAATVLQPTEYVLYQIERLDPPEDRFEQTEPAEKTIRRTRGQLLLTAAKTASDRGLNPGPFFEAVAATVDPGDEVWIDARCLELLGAPNANMRRTLQAELASADFSNLPPRSGLDVLEVLWHTGESEAAARKLIELQQPTTPDTATLGNDRAHWHDLYRFLRLKSGLDRPLEPTDAIPTSDEPYREEAVYVARHLAVLAALDGATLAGRTVTAAEVTAATRQFLAFWDARGHTIRMSGLRAVRLILIRAAIRTAKRISQEAVRELFKSFERRWDESAHTVRHDGWDVLGAFRGAGIGDVSVARRLDQIEQVDDLDVHEWLEHTRAWLELRRSDRAEQTLARVVDRSFTVGYRKDYQLSEWIPLLHPKLTGADGERHATWLAERLVVLGGEIEPGATHDAGQILVNLLTATSLSDAHRIARMLEEGNVLSTDDVIASLLEASASSGEQAWWLGVRELLCPFGVTPPRGIDAALAATSPDVEPLSQLRETVERVAVEGRPSLRVQWRRAIQEAAASSGFAADQIGITDGDLEYSDESPSPEWANTSSGDEHDEQSGSLDEMLEQLESGETDYRLRSSLRAAIPDAPEEFVKRVLATVAGSDEEARFLAAASGRLHKHRDIDGAWSLAAAALATGTARDWSRSWAGGPALDAIAIMNEIDKEQTRPLIFARFSALASEDQFLLTEVGRDIGEFADVFAPIDRDELAQDISNYLEELLGPPDTDARPNPDADMAMSDSVTDLVRALILELLAAPYTLAWTTAQRTALELHRSGAPSAPLLTAALDDPAVPSGRTLALVEAELAEARALDDTVIERVVALAQASRLDVRQAAGRILDRIEVDRPSLPEKPLPPSLRLELPQRIGSSETAVDNVVRAVAEILELHEGEISVLAGLARIDVNALREHVSQRAVRITTSLGLDRPDDLFGWAYVKPAARAVFAALAETAAEVVDAGKVSADTGEEALGLGALFDLHLLLTRPERRPVGVVPAIPERERKPSIDGNWLSGLEDADGRLSCTVDGWHVIGESTLLRQLARQGPEEVRTQALSLDQVRIPHVDARVTSTDLRERHPAIKGSLLIRGTYRPIESEHDWLALQPAAALDAGFSADEHNPFGWTLEGTAAVRSLWWRSGFTYWDPSSPHDEVGEGWLVLATPDALARLRDTFPKASITWSVTRTWRPVDEGEVSDSRSGIRHL